MLSLVSSELKDQIQCLTLVSKGPEAFQPDPISLRLMPEPLAKACLRFSFPAFVDNSQ